MNEDISPRLREYGELAHKVWEAIDHFDKWEDHLNHQNITSYFTAKYLISKFEKKYIFSREAEHYLPLTEVLHDELYRSYHNLEDNYTSKKEVA